jgi:hypothetical protein
MDKPVQKPALDKSDSTLIPKPRPRKSAYAVIMTSFGVFVLMAFTFAILVVIRFNFDIYSWVTWTCLALLCGSATVAGICILIENHRLAKRGGNKLFGLNNQN